jgi:nucleoid DNA-binding protein
MSGKRRDRIAEKRIPFFKAGKAIKKALNKKP